MEAHVHQRRFTNASYWHVFDSNYTALTPSPILVLELRNWNFLCSWLLNEKQITFSGGQEEVEGVVHHFEEHTSVDL